MAEIVRQHRTERTGGPCVRCGLVYSPETAYIPCFAEGDTLETWLERHPEARPFSKIATNALEIRVTPERRERHELDWEDMKLLVRRNVPPTDPMAREVVLVGRLQRELRVDNDGRYGPRTHDALRKKELMLGPELSAIVRRYRRFRELEPRR